MNNSIADGEGHGEGGWSSVSRRRFLAWTGAAAAATGMGALGLHELLQGGEPTQKLAGGDDTVSIETRKMFLTLTLPAFAEKSKLAKAATDVYFVAFGKKYPVLPHTANTWAYFQGENAAAIHFVDREMIPYYIADPQDITKIADVVLSSKIVSLGTVWATIGNVNTMTSIKILIPQAATQEVMETGIAADSNILASDKRFAIAFGQKHLRPTSVAQAVDLSSIALGHADAALSQINVWPTVFSLDPIAAAITTQIINHTNTLSGVVSAMKAFDTPLGVPYGVIKNMVKYYKEDGTPVPQTMDPRIDQPALTDDEQTELDAAYTAGFGSDGLSELKAIVLPEIPHTIGSQLARYFHPFIIEGMVFPSTPKPVAIPAATVNGLVRALKAAYSEIGQLVGNEPRLGAEISPEMSYDDAIKAITGKSWWSTPNTPVKAMVATTAARGSTAALAGAPTVTPNTPVTFTISPNDQTYTNGLKATFLSANSVNGETVLKVRVENNQARCCDVGIQYRDAFNLPIMPNFDPNNGPQGQNVADAWSNDPTWSTGGTAKTNKMLSSVGMIMGISTGGAMNGIDYQLAWQPKAVSAKLVVGTFGTSDGWEQHFQYVITDPATGTPKRNADDTDWLWGTAYVTQKDDDNNQHYSPEWYANPVLYTMVGNLIMPALLTVIAASAVGFDFFSVTSLVKKREIPLLKEKKIDKFGNKGMQPVMGPNLKSTMRSNKAGTGASIAASGFMGLYDLLGGQSSGSTGGSLSGWLLKMVDTFFEMLLYWAFTKWYALYLANAATSALVDAIPVVGAVFAAAQLGADIALLNQGCNAVENLPNTTAFVITGTYPATLTVTPSDATFSKSAASWYATVQYQGSLTSDAVRVEPSDFASTIQNTPCVASDPSNPPADPDTRYVCVAVVKDFQGGPRTDPLVITVPTIGMGGRVRFVVKILSQDGWEVGSAVTDYMDNYDIHNLPSKVSIVAYQQAVPLQADSTYTRRYTTNYVGDKTTMDENAVVDGTSHDKDPADMLLGSVGAGEGTGLVTYAYGNAKAWYVRQVAGTSSPNKGEARLPGSFDRQPHIFVDPLARLKAKGAQNWLLEPFVNSAGYHLRSLSIDQTTVDYDKKLSYGYFANELHAACMSPDGKYITGVNQDTGQYYVLRTLDSGVPALGDATGNAPPAVPYSRPGTIPGTLNAPIGVTMTSTNTVLTLEHGTDASPSRRLQAFDVSGNATKQFKNAKAQYVSYLLLDQNLTYQDIGTDTQDYVFLLGHTGSGDKVSDYVLQVFQPSVDPTPLFKVHSVNVGRMALGYYRDVYTLNFRSIATSQPGSTQPSLSIWTARTPNQFIGTGKLPF